MKARIGSRRIFRKKSAPVFPLSEALLLPRTEMPLNIFEPRYIAMVDAGLTSRRIIGMIQPDEGKVACALGPALRDIGCAGRITSFAETGDGRYMITLAGVARFRVLEELSATTLFPPSGRQFRSSRTSRRGSTRRPSTKPLC